MRRYYQDNKTIALIFLLVSIFITGCNNTNYILPQEKDIVDVVFASGYIAKSNEYNVTANTEGFLRQSFLSEGDSITIGTPLFNLSNEVQSVQLDNAAINYNDAKLKAGSNSPQLAQLKIQIEQARTQLDLDRRNFERYNNLIKTNAVSQMDFEKAKLQLQASESNVGILEASLRDLENSLNVNLKNSKNQLKIQQENNSDYIINSTLTGTVLNIYKEQGELVRRGEIIAKVGGGKDVIKLYVAEEDISRIALGQVVKVSLNTNENEVFDAQISKIYPAFDTSKQSFIVEAIFIEQPKALFPGTQLQANIIIAQKQNALLLPIECIEKGDSVQTDNKKIPVKIGIRNNEWAEIIEGIDATTKIKLPKSN